MDAPVLVVGGGPVGATLGLLMPEALVVDAAQFPRDKACGEGLMPAGAAVLRAAGVDLAAEGFPAVRGVSYRLPGGAVGRADFSTGTGFGTRRTRLDALLAERCGVHQGITVERVTAHSDRVEVETSTGTISTSILVAADGLRSPVARMMGWWRPPRGRLRYAMVGHLQADPLSSDIEVSLLGEVETYMAAVGEGEILSRCWGQRAGCEKRGSGASKVIGRCWQGPILDWRRHH
jgi:flavin-dependent dehydrogenase